MSAQISKLLRNNRSHLSRHQYKILQRQIQAGDAAGALHGLQTVFGSNSGTAKEVDSSHGK